MLIKVETEEILKRLMPIGYDYQDLKAHETKVRTDYLEETAEHELTIVHDEGVHRHLSIAKPGQNAGSFQVTTWPGHIAISGDMGDFTFSRIPDMFEFVRGNQDFGYYWLQKCVAGEPREELDMSKMVDSIASYLYDDDEPRTNTEFDSLIKALKTNVICASSIVEAYDLARDFDYEGFGLDDFHEYPVVRTSWRFLWICNAIADAVRMYDVVKGNPTDWVPKSLQREAMRVEAPMTTIIIPEALTAEVAANRDSFKPVIQKGQYALILERMTGCGPGGHIGEVINHFEGNKGAGIEVSDKCHDRSNFRNIQSALAWALVGRACAPESPSPKIGDRILILPHNGHSPEMVGRTAIVTGTPNPMGDGWLEVLVDGVENGNCRVGYWAVLPA